MMKFCTNTHSLGCVMWNLYCSCSISWFTHLHVVWQLTLAGSEFRMTTKK